MLPSRNLNKLRLVCLYRRRYRETWRKGPLMEDPPARSLSAPAHLPPWALSPAARPWPRTIAAQWTTGQPQTQSLCFASEPCDQRVCIVSFLLFAACSGHWILMKLRQKLQLLSFLRSPLPPPARSASQQNNWPPKRCKVKRTAWDQCSWAR